MEELRQREANLTALQAIGPRKKPKLEVGSNPGGGGQVKFSSAVILKYFFTNESKSNER